jgi:DNA-binding NtrC family response regulator
VRGHLLVIDADVGTRDTLATALRKRGWLVETGENGARAIELVQAGQVQVIVTDVDVVDFQELQFPRAIRGCVPRKLLLVGFTTATEEIPKVKRSGYDEVIGEPIDIDVLELWIARWLQHHTP